MKTTSTNKVELNAIETELESMENNALQIADFGRVLQGITDGETIVPEYVPGIYRMVVEIIECADSLVKTHGRLLELVAPFRVVV